MQRAATQLTRVRWRKRNKAKCRQPLLGQPRYSLLVKCVAQASARTLRELRRLRPRAASLAPHPQRTIERIHRHRRAPRDQDKVTPPRRGEDAPRASTAASHRGPRLPARVCLTNAVSRKLPPTAACGTILGLRGSLYGHFKLRSRRTAAVAIVVGRLATQLVGFPGDPEAKPSTESGTREGSLHRPHLSISHATQASTAPRSSKGRSTPNASRCARTPNSSNGGGAATNATNLRAEALYPKSPASRQSAPCSDPPGPCR